MSMRNAWAAMGLLAAVATGCGSGAGGPATSPKEVYDRASAAAKADKFSDILPLYPPAEQDMVVFSVLIGSGFVTMGKDQATQDAAKKEIEAISKARGVKEQKEQPILNPSDQKAMADAATKMLDGADKAGLFGDLVKFIEKHAEKSMSLKDSMTGELKDLKIEGDKATAKVGEHPVAFAKVGEGWYLSRPTR